MVIKVHKPASRQPPKRKQGRNTHVPKTENDGEWGPPKFTKQIQRYVVNYKAIMMEWAKQKHAEVCRPNA